MNGFSLTTQVISIVSILVPIGIGLTAVKAAGKELRLLLLFLVIGLITDVTMFYLAHTGHYNHLLTIFAIYSLSESIFFYWFSWSHIQLKNLKRITLVLMIATPVFWLIFIIGYPDLLFTESIANQVFDTIYEIVAAMLSGYALLKLVEKEESVLLLPGFWVLLGIFFYCFCTFFIMAFLNTVISQHIWFLNHIVNVITYVSFSIAFWRSRRIAKSSAKTPD